LRIGQLGARHWISFSGEILGMRQDVSRANTGNGKYPDRDICFFLLTIPRNRKRKARGLFLSF
jgi:hypothetical protein